ncbi:hypothetical protein BG004_003962 [Podila humilis]|nr:hypothetical protein BG004_003962 [Podila humilis]
MLRLSEEILLWIFAFVRNQRSLSQAGATCKRLWRIAHDPYLWKFVILDHTVSLRKHWAKFVKPRLISAGVQDLTLLGEIPPPVHIDRLQLNDFRSLQALRLDDIRTYSVYTLARTLPWLRIFEARRIKGSSDIWDWRPFRGMRHLEELMLWRDESPLLPFNLSIDAVDDIYPHEAIYEATYGAHLPGVYDDDLDILDDADVEGDDQDELELLSLLPPIPSIVDEETESATSVLNAGSGPNPEQEQQHLTPVLLLPRLKKLALVNIGSMTTHQGTDSVMRKLVGRCHTFIYGNSFNILFPMVKTSYRQLRHLTLLEPSGPAWKNGTGQNHARVFEQMTLLESIQIVNPNMSRKFMVPIVDALLGLRSLRLLHVVLLELDIENVDAIFRHVIATNDWHGTLRLTLKVEPELGDVVINTPKSMRRGWLRRRELDLADMYFDEQDTSDGSTSSSLYGGSRRGSAASTSALVTSSEWCRWACEEAKALGHRVVAMGEGLAGSTGRDLGKKGADDCSVSSDKLSVEIEMITKTQASDLDLSQRS